MTLVSASLSAVALTTLGATIFLLGISGTAVATPVVWLLITGHYVWSRTHPFGCCEARTEP